MPKKAKTSTPKLTTNERQYNDGEWTASRYRGFVTSALRGASRRWPVKYKVLADAYVGKKTNPKTKREGKHYKCANCLGEYPSSMVQVDHKIPIIHPEVGFTTWDDYINHLYCERDNLQVLCKPCHDTKTKQERAEAQKWKQRPTNTQGQKTRKKGS